MALWREVAGYEGLYLVSDQGDVVAVPKEVRCGNKLQHRKRRPLKPHLRGKNGLYYKAVALTKNGETRQYSVHRLVAQAFIENPELLPEVNHKDENPLNNSVDNLEWCTRQYNMEYSKAKPIFQIFDDGTVVRHKSIKAASEQTNIGRTAINNALTGWANRAGGYKWTYCD